MKEPQETTPIAISTTISTTIHQADTLQAALSIFRDAHFTPDRGDRLFERVVDGFMGFTGLKGRGFRRWRHTKLTDVEFCNSVAALVGRYWEESKSKLLKIYETAPPFTGEKNWERLALWPEIVKESPVLYAMEAVMKVHETAIRAATLFGTEEELDRVFRAMKSDADGFPLEVLKARRNRFKDVGEAHGYLAKMLERNHFNRLEFWETDQLVRLVSGNYSQVTVHDLTQLLQNGVGYLNGTSRIPVPGFPKEGPGPDDVPEVLRELGQTASGIEYLIHFAVPALEGPPCD